MSLVLELARICARPATPADRARAALHVAAWTGAAALAAATPQAAMLQRGYALPHPTAPGPDDSWSRLLHDASLGCMHELDDFHRGALVHPGPIVIPAALHTARQVGATGADVLVAVLRGYEAMIRIGESVGRGHYEHWHNTSTCGTAGAAAAAASLLELDAARTAHALALALTQSSGLWQVRLDPCDAKPWHAARAAQTGVQAALLARAGIRGPARVLEGEKGFYAAMCSDPLPDRISAHAEGPWKIHQTTFKPWASCRHTHPVIDAALTLREGWQAREGWQQLPLDNILAIRLETYADAIAFCDRARPATDLEARFSLHHAVAVTLSKGAPGVDDFCSEAVANPACMRLRAITSAHSSDAYSARYPGHFGAAVAVTLKNGRTLRHAVPDALGDPERPLTPAQVLELALRLMTTAGWEPGRAGRRLAEIMELDVQKPAFLLRNAGF